MLNPFLADAAASTDGGLIQTLIMIGIVVVFFYFLLYRPEQVRRNKLNAQRSAMKKGDKVTAMGIVGTVLKINENTVVICSADNAKLEILKQAITDVQATTTSEAPQEEKK